MAKRRGHVGGWQRHKNEVDLFALMDTVMNARKGTKVMKIWREMNEGNGEMERRHPRRALLDGQNDRICRWAD